MNQLLWPDYLILMTFLVISLGIGVYHSLTGGRQKTTSEFIMANRSLNVLPTALSLLVSFQSALLILGMTAEMYSYGSNYFILSMFSFTLAMILTMQLAVPWIYQMKLVSVNEYFERRFKSKSVRILASITSIISNILYMGVAMYAPSAALESVTGLPIVVSIPIMAAVTITYTALGGMRAVIWTDVFQCFIMFGGLLAILIKGLVVVGGFDNVFRICSESGRLDWVNWSPDPTVRDTVWGYLFGHSIMWFSFYAFSQAAVQRYSAVKTLSKAKLTIALNLPVYYVLMLIVCFIGQVVVSYYASIRCDPLANRQISNSNQLLPHFVLKMFADAPGFAGLFLATLYGAALSSVSSALSGSAANCWEDILQWKLMHWTESRKALLNRILVALFGIAATGQAFLAASVPGPVTQLSMTVVSAVIGPCVGLMLLGGVNRHANWKGAIVGGITGLLFSFWLTIGAFALKRRHQTLPPLSIDGCMAPNNLTFSNYEYTNSSSVYSYVDESPISTTMTNFSPLTNQTNGVDYQGLEKFYSISYLWYNAMSVLVTILIGSVASFLLRDRSMEENVDENLLINFRNFFSWNGNQNSNSKPEIFSVNDYDTVVGIRTEENGKKEQSIDQ